MDLKNNKARCLQPIPVKIRGNRKLNFRRRSQSFPFKYNNRQVLGEAWEWKQVVYVWYNGEDITSREMAKREARMNFLKQYSEGWLKIILFLNLRKVLQGDGKLSFYQRLKLKTVYRKSASINITLICGRWDLSKSDHAKLIIEVWSEVRDSKWVGRKKESWSASYLC